MNHKHYYVRSKKGKWEKASDDVVNALKNPCAFKHPPANSNCPPGEYENAPIQFEDAMINVADKDFTANVITRNTIVLGTDDRGADDVEGYNENWAKKRLNELAGILKGMSPDRVRLLLVKTETINIRCTSAEKQEIKVTAKKYRLSQTEYLLSLHRIIQGK